MIAESDLRQGQHLRVVSPQRREDVLIPFPGVALPEVTFPQPISRKERRSSPLPFPKANDEVTRFIVNAQRETSTVKTSETLANTWKVGMQELEKGGGSTLVDKVLENRTIETVVFMGPPGVGKSTAIEAFIGQIIAACGESIAIKFTSFDPAFQDMMKREKDRGSWNGYHWEYINGSLYLSSKEKKARRSRGKRLHAGRTIEVVEVPFIGSKKTSDRGRSFVEAKWRDAVAQNKIDSVVFVPFARVKPTVIRSANFREEIAQAKRIEDKLNVLKKYGISLAVDTAKTAKAKIQEMIRNALKQITHSASKKQLNLVEEDMRIMLREELPDVSYNFLTHSVPLPASLDASTFAYEIRRDVLFWEMTLDKMGVPSDQRFILLNPPRTSVQRIPLMYAA